MESSEDCCNDMDVDLDEHNVENKNTNLIENNDLENKICNIEINC